MSIGMGGADDWNDLVEEAALKRTIGRAENELTPPLEITPLEYAGGITVERRLLDTEQYGVIEGRAKRLAVAANRKMNKIAHEPFIYPPPKR